MCYAFVWVIPRRLDFIFRRFETLCSIHVPTRLWIWSGQSVPKRRHITFRRRGITQKKAYSKLRWLILSHQYYCNKISTLITILFSRLPSPKTASTSHRSTPCSVVTDTVQEIHTHIYSMELRLNTLVLLWLEHMWSWQREGDAEARRSVLFSFPPLYSFQHTMSAHGICTKSATI